MAGYNEGWRDALRMTNQGPFVDPRAFGGHGPLPQFTSVQEKAEKPKRKCSAYSKRVGREIKKLNKAHKSGGKFKKGWNQKRLMKAAHKAAKR